MRKVLSKDQTRDAGLCLVLLMLLAAHGWNSLLLIDLIIIFLVLVMTVPKLFLPWARVWYFLSDRFGGGGSAVLLTLIFYGMVWPVGAVRRLFGKDPLQLKGWKSGDESVFRHREKIISREDLEHPY